MSAMAENKLPGFTGTEKMATMVMEKQKLFSKRTFTYTTHITKTMF